MGGACWRLNCWSGSWAARLARGGDFAEVYLQDRTVSSISLEDRKIERLQAGRERGAGLRVVIGAVTGFAYTDDLSEASLLRAAEVASGVARSSPVGGRLALKRRRHRSVARELDPPERRTERERAELVRRVDQAARASGDAIRQVSARLSHSRQRVTIANSEGLLAADERLELQLSAAVTAEREGLRQVGRRVRGGQAGLEC